MKFIVNISTNIEAENIQEALKVAQSFNLTIDRISIETPWVGATALTACSEPIKS